MARADRLAIVYKVRSHEVQDVIETVKKILKPKIMEELSISEISEKALRDFDLILSLGGDGTLIRVARAAKSGALILPVNLGKKGYLIETDPGSLEEYLKKYCDDDFLIEKCFKLRIYYGGKSFNAVNEVVVRNAIGLKQVELLVELRGGGFEVEGDGFLISTPIGSSAYSLNAGGPFVMSDVNVLICTPLCARKPLRPLIVNKDEVITVKYLSGEEAYIILDGEEMHKVNPEVPIKVTGSDEVVNIMRFSNNFNVKRMSRLAGGYENG